MKKLSLVAAIAAVASLSTGAHAVTSSINNNAQLYIGTIDIAAATPCSGPLAIGGTTPSAVTLTGTLCLEPSGPGSPPTIQLDFGLGGGTVAANGTTFTSGVVDIYTDWGSGFQYYSSVNASVTNIPCLVQQIGHLGTSSNPPPVVNNTTFGLHPKTGTWPLPGLWHPNVSNDGINDAVCVMDLFGFRAGLFLDGTVTD